MPVSPSPTATILLADTITERYRSMVITMAWATLHIGEAMDHLDRFAGDTYVFTAPVAEDRYTLRIGESFIVIQPSKRRSCIVFARTI
jgi:hypothetical protein